MKKINISENRINGIITESIHKILLESTDVFSDTQELIKMLNDSYQSLVNEYGDEYSCMDKNGNVYGFSKPVSINGNGYVIFPYIKDMFGYEPIRIKAFTKSGGKVRYYKDETHYDNDYRDAIKLIKTTIKDIIRCKKHLEGYDPDWESEDNPNGKKNINSFNKSIGIRN
jgi:hypothetical protein